MRWLNKYHRGFNRLWLVFCIVGAFSFVGVNWLSDAYKVYIYENVNYENVNRYKYNSRGEFLNSKESKIKQRVQKRWREWVVNEERIPPEKNNDVLLDEEIDRFFDKYPVGESFSVKEQIFRDVDSMKESQSFTRTQLNTIIDNSIAYEKQIQEANKTYPIRLWKARGRIVRDLLGAFIVTFAMGHGVLLVVWWIIRGFR